MQSPEPINVSLKRNQSVEKNVIMESLRSELKQLPCEWAEQQPAAIQKLNLEAATNSVKSNRQSAKQEDSEVFLWRKNRAALFQHAVRRSR